MYRLLSGLYEHLTRKETFSIIIIGLDNSGKTTMLERIKLLFNPQTAVGGSAGSAATVNGDVDTSKIGPTVGQNIGKVQISSAILQFWDLGGQRDIRSIWGKYYGECQGVVYVVDASDRERLEEGWAVFDTVLSSPQTLNLPLLLLANKQDIPSALSSTEIRQSYEDWAEAKRNAPRPLQRVSSNLNGLSSGQATGGGSGGDSPSIGGTFSLLGSGMEGRGGSLEVLGVSALKGTGVREAVDWLFLRVQNSRRIDER